MKGWSVRAGGLPCGHSLHSGAWPKRQLMMGGMQSRCPDSDFAAKGEELIRKHAKAFVVTILLGGSSAAIHADTTTYQYDALGRLIASSVAGSSATTSTAIGYDPAGNRSSYARTGGGGGGNPPAAPVPKSPGFSVSTGSTTVIALATLATINTTAAITAFSPPSGGGTATIAADRQSVTYIAPSLPAPGMCDPAYYNLYSVSYTVQNTPGGASASGTATFTVRSAAGPRPRPPEVCP